MAPWRYVLCDRLGNTVANLSQIAQGATGSWRRHRPTSLSFRVPASDPNVAAIHDDGLPRLWPRARTLKAYRQEPGASLSGYVWTLRFAGHVWSCQDDSGGAEGPYTQVGCLDPSQMLTRRLCRDGSGAANLDDTKLVQFTASDAVHICRVMINNSNIYGGATGIDPQIYLAGNVPTAADRTVRWERKFITPAIHEASENGGGFEFSFEPLDQIDGNLVWFNCVTQLGSDKSASVVFSWGTKGRQNCSRMTRLQDGERMVNREVGLGATQEGAGQDYAHGVDTPSGLTYGYSEAVTSYTDSVEHSYLDALVQRDIAFLRNLHEPITFAPIAGLAPQPWADWVIGDTVTVRASAEMRGGFEKQIRIEGFDLSMGDVETVTSVVVAEKEPGFVTPPIQDPRFDEGVRDTDLERRVGRMEASTPRVLSFVGDRTDL